METNASALPDASVKMVAVAPTSFFTEASCETANCHTAAPKNPLRPINPVSVRKTIRKCLKPVFTTKGDKNWFPRSRLFMMNKYLNVFQSTKSGLFPWTRRLKGLSCRYQNAILRR
ncbi:hypothetical protein [Endozoicomonas lisbonensis]|uniref:Uncharacterized protein n=1 Tax=Endozoicomonas lisbonensis TaxID=3120522 RepID=A0ABV2SH42_9GAMM